jgi:hypothetical protein
VKSMPLLETGALSQAGSSVFVPCLCLRLAVNPI